MRRATTWASTGSASGRARRRRLLLDDLGNGDIRCLVADLGSLATSAERTLVAGSLLERLWSRRAEREPIAIVIDEAHNVCPAVPRDPLTALATEEAIRIAGEGRKFGLYLIVVTRARRRCTRTWSRSATTSC